MKEKVCSACGRLFSIRKKWKENWNEIRYCSSSCGQMKKPELLMEKILYLLSMRAGGQTICPSEVLLDKEKKVAKKMERVRCAARLLAWEGKIVITQKGRVVEPGNFKGPIRLRLKK